MRFIGKHIVFTALVFIVITATRLKAQESRMLIQLTGIVVSGENALGVPGAFVFVPKTGRGTSSDYIGYFSMPIHTGDTLLVKAIGFKQQSYVVPQVKEKTTVIITLSADLNYLPMVEVFPWPTEKLFKEAFLALELDRKNNNYAAQNLNDVVIRRMLINQKDDGSMNHRYFMDQQYAQLPGSGVQQFRLLDPFAWRKFLESSKKGQLRQQEEKYKEKE
ncbi:MAG: carboxypeptidase-like regulatory domain-containing protein [Cytophagales bacterium]|nr:MAG: carboxypeptidase-like regulatory domain-containing protein [Cytophagales bacterium]